MFFFSSQQPGDVLPIYMLYFGLFLAQVSGSEMLYVCESVSPFYNPDKVLLPTLLAGIPSCDRTLQWFSLELVAQVF